MALGISHGYDYDMIVLNSYNGRVEKLAVL